MEISLKMNFALTVTTNPLLSRFQVSWGKNGIRLAATVIGQSENKAIQRNCHVELTAIYYNNKLIFTIKILQMHPKVNIKINTSRTLPVISSLYKYIHRRGSFQGHSSIENGF